MGSLVQDHQYEIGQIMEEFRASSPANEQDNETLATNLANIWQQANQQHEHSQSLPAIVEVHLDEVIDTATEAYPDAVLTSNEAEETK